MAASPRRVFQSKANIRSAFFPRRNFLVGVLKICIANKNLLIQTEKIERTLPVPLKKKKEM